MRTGRGFEDSDTDLIIDENELSYGDHTSVDIAEQGGGGKANAGQSASQVSTTSLINTLAISHTHTHTHTYIHTHTEYKHDHRTTHCSLPP